VNKPTSTKDNFNRIIEFRQAIYESGFDARRDALFDLLDAMVAEGRVASFPMLSLSSHFRRRWPSLYGAVEDGKLNSAWLSTYLALQVPQEGIQVFPLDGSAWARPRARTLDDRQFVYQPTAAVNGGSVCIGYPYSLLAWTPEVRSSWSLSIDVRRVASDQTAQELGAEQIKHLAKARQACSKALDIVAADAKYGNSGFLRSVRSERCGVVVRLRRDRVLYHAPGPHPKGQRGRPRVHGTRFAFKQSDTWGTPAETIQLEDPYWGQVKLERWNNLHEHKGADVPYDVVRASVHLERNKPPASIWLAWQAPPVVPEDIPITVETIWRTYHWRWPVEPGIRYCKQHLGWTQPQFQTKEAGDRWSDLVALAMWLLFLARPVVEDHPLPWQKPQTGLTPQRVQQGIRAVLDKIGTPARPPKTRGKPAGWLKGRARTPKRRFAVVKKRPVIAKTA